MPPSAHTDLKKIAILDHYLHSPEFISGSGHALHRRVSNVTVCSRTRTDAASRRQLGYVPYLPQGGFQIKGGVNDARSMLCGLQRCIPRT